MLKIKFHVCLGYLKRIDVLLGPGWWWNGHEDGGFLEDKDPQGLGLWPNTPP